MAFRLITDEPGEGELYPLVEETIIGARLQDWLIEVEGSPGIVVDEELARRTPCVGYRIDGKEYLWSKGIIGMLSEEQIKEYCPEKIIKPKIPERVMAFREAAEGCKRQIEKVPKPGRLVAWLKCMGAELRKREVEI